MKAAVIGLGRMGAEPSSRLLGRVPDGWLPLTHAEAVQSIEGLELVAICDKDEARLDRFSKLYHVNKCYTDYNALIDEMQPELLCVATRTDIRCAIIHYGLDHGVKGFYAEKPLTRSINECKDVLAHIQQKNAFIAYGATRRAIDIYKRAKEICWSGELGEVIQVTTEYGRSSLLWSQPHAVDLIIYFSNSADIVSIEGHCNLSPNDEINHLIDSDPIIENAFYKFSNGVSGIISQANGANVRVACSKGNLTIHGDGSSIEINRSKNMIDYFDSYEDIHMKSKKSGTQTILTDLKNSIENNIPLTCISPKEILCGQLMLFGIVESTLQDGKIIYPSDIRGDLIITGRTGELYA